MVPAVTDVNWDELRARIEPNQTHYDWLVADLHELRTVVTEQPYRRYSSVDEVGDYLVVVAAPKGDRDAAAVRRGAGVL